MEKSEVHSVMIEFSAEQDKKDLDKLLIKIGKLLRSSGINNITVKDEYYVDWVPADDGADNEE